MIKNLSQLKKAINEKRHFIIRKHYVRPEYEGQERIPNVIQTNAFYSVVANEPENPVSLGNRGKGSFCEYGKASDWTFEDGVCKQNYFGKPLWEIEFI